MANPPYSGFVLIAVEGQDGLELEAWAYDEKIATTITEMNNNVGSRVGFVVPPSPIGLRETLAAGNPDRYFDRRAANRTTAKTMTSALIDLVFPETTA